jgi:O-antigen ligase
VLVAAATGVALFALFFNSSMLHSLGRNSTLTGRTEIWAAVLAQHTNPFIGTGFESFWMGTRMQSVWDLSQVGIEESHNGYIEFYVNLGWIGVAILGLLIVSGYRNAIGLFRRSPQAGSVRIALFTAALIFNCTEAGFRMMTLIWIGFLLAITDVPQMVMEQAHRERVPLRQMFSHRKLRVLQ